MAEFPIGPFIELPNVSVFSAIHADIVGDILRIVKLFSANNATINTLNHRISNFTIQKSGLFSLQGNQLSLKKLGFIANIRYVHVASKVINNHSQNVCQLLSAAYSTMALTLASTSFNNDCGIFSIKSAPRLT